MLGVDLDQIKEKVFEGHEIEFSYNGSEYSIELDFEESQKYVCFWNCSANEPKCLCRVKVESFSDMDACFNTKCIDGKSIKEIEKEVVVDTIF